MGLKNPRGKVGRTKRIGFLPDWDGQEWDKTRWGRVYRREWERDRGGQERDRRGQEWA